jgi:rhomboid protease GluP
MDQEQNEVPQEEQKPEKRNPLHIFIPRRDYFFTPILININILVFVVMVISGVHPWSPSGQAMVDWGANYRPYTMNGQPWRLFTCMFLHIGILHLFVNMYSLFSLGQMLERFIGKWRFLGLYIFTGLCGSAISLWWYTATPSAGASGAIFGLFGVFVAIVTTKLIEPTIRKRLLRGIGTTILINGAISLWASVDTSAHLGGFLSGLLGGYLIFFDLKAFYQRRVIQYKGFIVSLLLISGVIVLFWMMVPVAYDNRPLVERYEQEHSRALDFMDRIDSTTSADEIEKKAVQPWQHNQAIVDSLIANGVPKDREKSLIQMQLYTAFRLKAAKDFYRAKKENRKDLIDSANASMNAADKIITSPIDEQ